MSKTPEVLDELVAFEEDYTDPVLGTQLVIKRTQDIPDDYISQLKADKIDTLHAPMGDFHRVASIPLTVVQKWDREGFNLEAVLADGVNGLRKVIDRLNAEALDAFITTRKQI